MAEAPQETRGKYATRVGMAIGTAVVSFARSGDVSKAAYDAEQVSDQMKGGARSYGSGRTLAEKREAGDCPDQRRSSNTS